MKNNRLTIKKLLYTLLAVTIIFSACEEEDESPTNSSSSSICGNVSVSDGAQLSYSPLTPCTGPGQPLYQVVNGELKGVTAAFTSFNGSIPEWMCTGQILVFGSESINLNQVYSSSSLPMGWTMNLTFSYFTSEGTYYNYELTNSTIVNGSITITDIDYANGLIDGNYSFIGYQMSGNNVKQFNCNFSDVPFTLQ
jgi:hypothetical protein